MATALMDVAVVEVANPNDGLEDVAMEAALMLRQDASEAIARGFIIAERVYALPAIVGSHITFSNHPLVTLIFTGCRSENDPQCAEHQAWYLQYQWAEHFRWVGGSHIEADGLAFAQYEYLGGEETEIDAVEGEAVSE